MSATAWIVLALVAVVVIWAIAVYNRLVQLRNRIANAFGQIDVQLKRRYDLVGAARAAAAAPCAWPRRPWVAAWGA